MTDADMRDLLSTIRRAMLMVVAWIDKWLEKHK